MKKNIPTLLIRGAEYLLIMFAGLLATGITHITFVGDLVVIVLFGYCSYSDLQRLHARQRAEHQTQEAERQARDLIAHRMATRIDAELTKTLATDNYTILSLSQWSASRMAEWPETIQTPAPLMAWDVVVQAHDGSCGPESLTIYVDAQLYTLPAVTLDEQLQGQYD